MGWDGIFQSRDAWERGGTKRNKEKQKNSVVKGFKFFMYIRSCELDSDPSSAVCFYTMCSTSLTH